MNGKTERSWVVVWKPTSLTNCFADYEQRTLNIRRPCSDSIAMRLINCGFIIIIYNSGGSKNFEKERRQCVSAVVIYRKCTQRTICLLYGKRRFIVKKMSGIRHWSKSQPLSIGKIFHQFRLQKEHKNIICYIMFVLNTLCVTYNLWRHQLPCSKLRYGWNQW